MSSSLISNLIMFISIFQVQAVYQMDMFFQPPVLANDQVVQNCIQYIDSELTDDYLTNCLLIEQLPQWKPSESAIKNVWNFDRIEIQGASYVLRYRINCYSDFYGETCSNFCKASNDPVLGFYSCSNEGEKVCLPGYSGASCTQKLTQNLPVYIMTEPKAPVGLPIVISYSFEMSCMALLVFIGAALLSCLVLVLVYLCLRQRPTNEAKVIEIPSVSEKLQYFADDLPPRYSNSPKESEYAEIVYSSKDNFIV